MLVIKHIKLFSAKNSSLIYQRHEHRKKAQPL